MASSSSSSSSSSSLLLFTLVFVISSFTNPSSSATANCSSQTFSNNRLFATCNDLPHLDSSIHWTYDPSKSSFSIAFLAPPPSPAGWIAWAINPTSKGMFGAQSLIAFHQSNGSMTVQTFDIKSYASITQSRISIEVSDLEGEFSNGEMTIFATVAVPGNATTLNQVWQVGPSVTHGVPDTHAQGPENLKALGTLDLLGGVRKNQPHSNAMHSNATSSARGNNPRQEQSTSSSFPSLVSCLISLLSVFVGVLTLLSGV